MELYFLDMFGMMMFVGACLFGLFLCFLVADLVKPKRHIALIESFQLQAFEAKKRGDFDEHKMLNEAIAQIRKIHNC